MPDQDDGIATMYRDQLMSIPLIGAALNLPPSRVRTILLRKGVVLRSRADGIRLRKDVLGKHSLGTTRNITVEWRENMREAAIRRGERTAKGISQKASGYVEITRGEDKGRGEHVIIIERRIGRRLLDDECVHHIDGIRSNNEVNNLALMTRSAHTKLHRREEALRNHRRERKSNGRFC